MHDNIEPLAGLIGTWRGRGIASYPTMKDAAFADSITFTDLGKPFLHYVQQTSFKGQLAHTECGYLRPFEEDDIEIVVAIPTGQAEIGAGTWTLDGAGLYISTDAQVLNTLRAKQVDRIVRSLHCVNDGLVYDLAMAAVGIGLTAHLHSELTRA